ncbi:MAG: hypothetical protein EOP47_16635 [Sphingobacteriaceae bacterium]|nr:MAG: hypothetical protein EOP47_16635 [Sphingobacteriaceae bacterium]
MKIHTKKIKVAFCIILMGSLCYTVNSYAGGWPTRKGKLLISPSLNYFFANKYWDSNGKVTSYEKDGSFTSAGLYMYSEYGLSKRVTLVGTGSFISNKYKQDDFENTSTGFSDVEIGARYYLGNIKYKYYFAIQGLAVLPAYKNTATRYLGYEAAGADVRLIGSCSGKLGSKSYYFNIEGGVRQYFADQGPFQVRYFSTFGYNFAPKHQVTLSGSGVISSSTNKAFSGNLVTNKDFNYLQGTLSYGYTVNKNLVLFAGVNRFLAGFSSH